MQVLVSSKQRYLHRTEGWAVLWDRSLCQHCHNPNRLKLNSSKKAATGDARLFNALSDHCFLGLCYWTWQHDGIQVSYFLSHKKGMWGVNILSGFYDSDGTNFDLSSGQTDHSLTQNAKYLKHLSQTDPNWGHLKPKRVAQIEFLACQKKQNVLKSFIYSFSLMFKILFKKTPNMKEIDTIVK